MVGAQPGQRGVQGAEQPAAAAADPDGGGGQHHRRAAAPRPAPGCPGWTPRRRRRRCSRCRSSVPPAADERLQLGGGGVGVGVPAPGHGAQREPGHLQATATDAARIHAGQPSDARSAGPARVAADAIRCVRRRARPRYRDRARRYRGRGRSSPGAARSQGGEGREAVADRMRIGLNLGYVTTAQEFADNLALAQAAEDRSASTRCGPRRPTAPTR